MKDKFIQKKLEFYADSLKCKEELLHDAYAQMDLVVRERAAFNARQNMISKKPAVKRSPLRAALITVAASSAAVFLFVVLLLSVLNNINVAVRPPQVAPYSLNSLARVPAELGEAQELENVKFIDEEEFVLTEAYLFKNKQNGEVYVAALQYKTTRNGSTDEILIVSDLKGGLTGFLDLREGETAKNYDVYEKGEYYSYIGIRSDGCAYYITITSPARYAAAEYENKFI